MNLPEDAIDDAGVAATEDGIVVATGSGHVTGPWDPDELALLDRED